VHDARVALTGRNKNISTKLASVRPHLLVMNKMDLINAKHKYTYTLKALSYILLLGMRSRTTTAESESPA